jgi:hypothetical protein
LAVVLSVPFSDPHNSGRGGGLKPPQPPSNEDSAIAGACRQQSKFVTLKAKTKGELSKPLFDENCLQFLYVKIDKLQSKEKSK